jgi:hypothetical protein
MPATPQLPARFLSFFIRVRTCRIAGASPLLFEVTFKKEYQDNRGEVAYDVGAVFRTLPTPPPTPPANVSRGLVEPFTGFPKGVTYAAGYIFILHESGKMYRCNVSNQQETCYQQNNMYRGNAFNWLVNEPQFIEKAFAWRMVREDDEHIIAFNHNELYRCSTKKPDSCKSIYNWRGDDEFHKLLTIAVGGGRIFGAQLNGDILSMDQFDGQYRVSSPSSMRRLSVWSTTLCRVSTWGEGYGIQPQRCEVCRHLLLRRFSKRSTNHASTLLQLMGRAGSLLATMTAV